MSAIGIFRQTLASMFGISVCCAQISSCRFSATQVDCRVRGCNVVLPYSAYGENRRCSTDYDDGQADRIDRYHAGRAVYCNDFRPSGYLPSGSPPKSCCAVRSIYGTPSSSTRRTCLGGWVDCRRFLPAGSLGWSSLRSLL
jgi:hypothetical protein